MVAFMTSPTAGCNDDYFNTQISMTPTAVLCDGSGDWGWSGGYEVDVPVPNKKWFLEFYHWGFPEDIRPVRKTAIIKTVVNKKILRCNRKGIRLRIKESK